MHSQSVICLLLFFKCLLFLWVSFQPMFRFRTCFTVKNDSMTSFSQDLHQVLTFVLRMMNKFTSGTYPWFYHDWTCGRGKNQSCWGRLFSSWFLGQFLLIFLWCHTKKVFEVCLQMNPQVCLQLPQMLSTNQTLSKSSFSRISQIVWSHNNYSIYKLCLWENNKNILSSFSLIYL